MPTKKILSEMESLALASACAMLVLFLRKTSARARVFVLTVGKNGNEIKVRMDNIARYRNFSSPEKAYSASVIACNIGTFKPHSEDDHVFIVEQLVIVREYQSF